MTEPNGMRGVQSVGRALHLLDLLSQSADSISLLLLAERSQLPVSTCYRLLSALRKGGFVAPGEEGKGYQLAPKALRLGEASTGRNLVNIAAPRVATLAEQLEETVNVVVRESMLCTIVYRHEPRQLLKYSVPVGASIPLHCTAAGKVLLAYSDEPDLLRRLRDACKLVRMTRQTKVTLRELEEEVRQIRERGLAYDNEEHVDGVRCVGAPIFHPSRGVVAAISVAGPKQRMNPVLPKITTRLIEVATNISRELGEASEQLSPSPRDRSAKL